MMECCEDGGHLRDESFILTFSHLFLALLFQSFLVVPPQFQKLRLEMFAFGVRLSQIPLVSLQFPG